MNAGLSQLEIDGSDWAREEDMRHGIDAIATAPNGHETRLACRTQAARFGDTYATITLRHTEVVRIAEGDYLADLHIQMYCDGPRLSRVVVAAYTDAFRTHLDHVADNDPGWRMIDEPGQPRTRMLVRNVATLKSLGALVWHWPTDRTIGVAMSNAAENGPSPDPLPALPDLAEGKSPEQQHYNALWQLAKITANTSMVPRPLRGKPDEAFAAMVLGDELGIGPMAALRSIHVIEGQPTASAQLMRALIVARGHLLSWRKVGDDRVELYGRRRDTGADACVVWTLDDARRAKLTGKGNWATYPRAMLAARATSELARLLFPDVLHGLAYTPEEVGAVGPYAAIDVDPETGEIAGYDDDAHVTTAEILDAEDAQDAEWLRAAARDADDEQDGRAAQLDLEDGDAAP
jgi:hypothetical protein